jgi:hypothetical protein
MDLQTGNLNMPLTTIRLTNLAASLDDKGSRIHRGSLFFIILIGFLLRWYSLLVGHAYTFFTIKDEISALQYAFGFMAGDPTTFYLGQPALNQGQIPGPLWAMFLAGLYKLGGNSVEGAIFLMILLNTFVIYLVYRLASRMMPLRYALFSALFYSLSPWAIYYSAGIYNPMPLAFIGVLLYLALWQTLNSENSRAIFWVMLLTAAIPQFHMIGVFYYPAIGLLLLLNSKRTNLRWLAAGIVAGVLLYVPYLIGEITHHWSNLHNVLHRTEKLSSGVLKVLTIPIGMLTNHPGEWPGYTTAELIEFANKWFGSYIILIAINLVSFILSLLFIARFLKRFYAALRVASFNLRSALIQDRPHIFIGILLILPLLLYLLTGKAYATRYSILIFPLLFLLPALYIASIKNPPWRQIVLYSMSLMFICNIYLVLSFYADQNHKLNSSSQFMPAFYKLEALYAALRKAAGNTTKIELDTTNLLDKNNKYKDITSNAISHYIELIQSAQHTQTPLNKTQYFTVVDTLAKVPANAEIIYRDNGLFVYRTQTSPK